MQRFGYDVKKLNGPDVHSLFNVMTMEKNVHDWFDRLDMWFESTVGAVVRIMPVLILPCNLDGPELLPRKNH